MTISTTLFETPGPHNTQRTVELALAAARELGIETIVIASTTGVVADCVLRQDFDGAAPCHRFACLRVFGGRAKRDAAGQAPALRAARHSGVYGGASSERRRAQPEQHLRRHLSRGNRGTHPAPVRPGHQGVRRGLGHCRRCRHHRAGTSDHRRRRHREAAPIRRWCCAPPTPTACLRQGSTFLSANPCVRSTNQPQRPVF